MNDGGPAFPAKRWVQGRDAIFEPYREEETAGMSLRAWLAGQALALTADPSVILDEKGIQRAAYLCVKLADAIIAELEKPA